MSIELIQASVLRPVVTTLRKRGIDVRPYLDEADIPAELLGLPYAPLAKRNQVWKFLEMIEHEEGLETVGFLLGDRMDLRELGPFGINISQAATLHDALCIVEERVADYAQGNRIQVKRLGESARLSTRTPLPKSRPADHYALKFLVAVTRLAAGPRWVPERATLQTGRVEAIFELPLCGDCEIEFDAPATSIEIPVTFLSRPLRTTKEFCSAEMVPLPEPGRLSDSLRVIVAAMLPHGGPPGAEKAAELVGVSRGTLRNRLSKEGTTYSELIDRVRYQAGQELLARSDASVKEIGHRLGYTSPNNFIRAFQRIAGVTPGAFREERQAVA